MKRIGVCWITWIDDRLFTVARVEKAVKATGRGWLTPKERLIPHKHFRDGQWNDFRVVAKGPRIQTWINGEPIEDLTDAEAYQTHPEGFIGLQVHGVKKGLGPYEVAWRKIRIKPL